MRSPFLLLLILVFAAGCPSKQFGIDDRNLDTELMRFPLGHCYLFPIRRNEKFGVIDNHGTELLSSKWNIVSGINSESGSEVHQFVGQRSMLLARPDIWVYLDGNGVVPIPAPCKLSEVLAIANLGDSLFRVVRSRRSPPSLPDLTVDPKQRWNPSRDIVPVSRFSEGLIVVKEGERFGFANREGTVVVDCIYGNCLSFSEGVAAVESSGLYGFIGHSGKYVIDPMYEKALGFDRGLAMVFRRGAMQSEFINHDGVVVDEYQPEQSGRQKSMAMFYDGLSLRPKGETGFSFNYLRPNGTWLTTQSFVSGGPFRESLAVVALSPQPLRNGFGPRESDWYLLYRDGTLGRKLDIEFAFGSRFRFGLCGSGNGYVNTSGEQVWPPKRGPRDKKGM